VTSADASAVVQLSLSTTAGTTGSAVFPGGVTSATVTVPVTAGKGSANFDIQGIQVSNTQGNIFLTATLQDNPSMTTSIAFSVVSVTISLNTAKLDLDDAIPTRVNPQITGLGPQIYPGSPTVLDCVVSVELVGTVTPSNYAGPITLRRTGIQRYIYLGQVDLGITPVSNFDDTSLAIALYQNVAKGKVFDLDTPGTPSGNTSGIAHYRANFQEYAVLGSASHEQGQASSTLQTSALFPYYAAVSCGGTAQIPAVDKTLPNDNQAGQGTIKTTFDLK
jgi:hypothetical protein